MIKFPEDMSVREIDAATAVLKDMREARLKVEKEELIAKMTAEARKRGFDIKDIIGVSRAKTMKTRTVAPKWMAPDKTKTWSGRGRKPLGFDAKTWERIGA